MPKKKLSLLIFLGFLSTILSIMLGSIDFLGFFDNRQTLNIALIAGSMAIVYLITITIFLLDFTNRDHLITAYLSVTAIFGIFYFIVSTETITTIVSMVIFFIFLEYTYSKSLARAKLFVKFNANEIFLPVVKRGFFLLVVLLASFSFFHTKNLLGPNSELTPPLVRIIGRPVVPILNKQFGDLIKKQIDLVFPSGTSDRQTTTRTLLKQSIRSLPESEIKKYLGVKPEEIPIERASVYPNGQIDLYPVFDSLLPQISAHLNSLIGDFTTLTPVFAALITLLFLQSVALPFGIIARLLTPAIFALLLQIKFIAKAKQMTEVEKITL